MSDMKWIQKHYKTILIWLLLIAVTPLFVEILYIANMVGAEVALAFLLIVVKDIYEQARYRLQQIKEFLVQSIKFIRYHPVCQANIYLAHSLAYLVALFFTGSMALSIIVWYPIVLFGGTTPW